MRRVDAAVALAVAEIEDEANQQPHDQSHPVRPAKAIDHGAARDDAKNGDERRRRHPERAFELGMLHAHDPHPGTHQYEGEQCSDARHFARDIRRHQRSERAGENEEKHVRFPWRAITRVHFGENRRDESIAAH